MESKMLREMVVPEIGVSSVEEMMARARERAQRMSGARRNLVPRERVRPLEPEPEGPPCAEPALKTKPAPKPLRPLPPLPDISHLPPCPFPAQRMLDICRVVADAHDVTVEEIISPARQSQIALARHTAIYLCARDYLKLSLVQVGDLFGRDHTTVHHAVSLLDRLYGTDVTGQRREARYA
jgi:hypothetical protein